MPDTVDVHVLYDGTRKLVVNMTNLSDGTGEGTPVTKIDLSATTHSAATAAGSNAPPHMNATLSKLSLEEIWWTVIGFDGVWLKANRTTDTVMANLPAGEGYKDYRENGGLVDKGTGETGDIQLTTYGTNAANNGYAIKATFKKVWSV